MKYFNVINDEFDRIAAQINGQVIKERIGEGQWTAAFPNTVMHTNSGNQFNVMGMLLVEWDSGGHGNFFLVMEPRTDFSNMTSIFEAGAMGTCFIVTPDGRSYDKELEKTLIPAFRHFAGKFREKYGGVPGFTMFLNEEQLSY